MNHVIIEKARPHKYLRRTGTEGHYEYFYQKPKEGKTMKWWFSTGEKGMVKCPKCHKAVRKEEVIWERKGVPAICLGCYDKMKIAYGHIPMTEERLKLAFQKQKEQQEQMKQPKFPRGQMKEYTDKERMEHWRRQMERQKQMADWPDSDVAENERKNLEAYRRGLADARRAGAYKGRVS